MNLQRLSYVSALAVGIISGPACSVVDRQAYIEREEKRFPAETLVDLHLTTYDGAIEIRSWDRPEVLVEIEKRGEDKNAVSRIVVTAERNGNTIQVEARDPGRTRTIGIGFFASASARLIATVPRACNLVVRTSDGSISLEHVDGKIELRTNDGNVKATEAAGDLQAETDDGTIALEDVTGHVEARTNDGSVRVSGTPGALHVRSGDGSVSLRIRRGAAMTDDWVVTTDDGTITAELPDDFNASIEAEPGSDNRARCDLALTNKSGGDRNDRVLRGQLGTGGHKLTLRTNDGSVRITNY